MERKTGKEEEAGRVSTYIRIANKVYIQRRADLVDLTSLTFDL